MRSYEGYEIIELIDEGTFGKVKLGRKNGSLYALKFCTNNNAYSIEMLEKIFIKQVQILSELNNPNIIKMIDYYKQGVYKVQGRPDQHRSAIIFEYAPHNLMDLLQFGPMNECICRTLMRQMLDGISYLHTKNIIHRDLKPQNILFDQHYTLKICDFGLSTKVQPENKPKTICGSQSFKSPQMLLKKNYNGVMNDLFAVGITLFILLTGKAPFITANPNAGFYQFIAMNYHSKFWKAHQKKVSYSKQFKNLLNSMLAFDPTHRLSIPEILSHPWMTQQIMMSSELQQTIKKIQEQIINIKRKAMLSKLKNKGLKLGINDGIIINRSLFTQQQSSSEVKRFPYCIENAKISDRFVPRLKNYEELSKLFENITGELMIRQEKIELVRIIQEEDGTQSKIVVIINVEEINQEEDCLKFKMKEGNVVSFVRTLQLFDEIILQQ